MTMSNIELAPQFIQGMNWEEFKKQRQFLIDVQEGLIVAYDQKEMAAGLINLCDAIVDYAIDFCELPEEDVLLTNDDLL
jgi:uncharacterized phage-like protein YoqJ